MEAATLLEIIDTQVLSALERELHKRTGLHQSLDSVKMSSKQTKRRLDSLLSSYEQLLASRDQLEADLNTSEGLGEDELKKSKHLSEKLFPQMQKLRQVCDEVESQVSDDLWPLPKYREILFLR